MKPLSEIVQELEAKHGGTRTRYDGKRALLDEADLLRLCAAFRVAERMRDNCYADNSGGEYRSKCADCGEDYYSKHADECAFAAWDAAVKGDE